MIIAISHQKGGVGKSTIAWNLAIGLQKKHGAELIDLDMQQTLFFTNEIRKQDKTLKPLIVKHFDNIDDLRLYIEGDSDERLSIIDLGGFDSDMSRVVIASADLVITPVSDRAFELFGIRNFERILRSISDIVEEKVKVCVLLNNLNPRKSNLDDLKSFINQSEHFNLLDTVLRTRADFNRSVAEGKSVIEYDKDGKASKEVKSLLKEIKTLLSLK